MERLSKLDRQILINAIANREGNARELAERFNTTVSDLKVFVADNKPAIEAAQKRLSGEAEQRPEELTPTQLDELWIGKKFERLRRLQEVAEAQYNSIQQGHLLPAEMTTAVREFRSYLALAANELGQLLHRGAGEAAEGDTLGVDIQGVNMDDLR
jgi:hypothetical protein